MSLAVVDLLTILKTRMEPTEDPFVRARAQIFEDFPTILSSARLRKNPRSLNWSGLAWRRRRRCFRTKGPLWRRGTDKNTSARFVNTNVRGELESISLGADARPTACEGIQETVDLHS